MDGGVRTHSCAAQPPSDRKTLCLENPRPKAEYSLTENVASPFQAEPRQEELPDAYRTIFMLRDIEDMTMTEAAEILEIREEKC